MLGLDKPLIWQISTLYLIFGYSLHAQVLDIHSLRIHDSIARSVNLSKLQNSPVKIDSITAVPETMDMSTADSLVFLGKTCFEYYRNSDMCELQVIVFDQNLKDVRVGDYILTCETTLEEIKSYFPKDCSITTPLEIYGDSHEYQTCSVPLGNSQGQIIDMSMLFFFLEGKLKRIDIWEPS